MENSESTFNNLIRGVSQSDPKLYSALQLLSRDIYLMFGEVFPDISTPGIGSLTGPTPADVTGLTIQTFPANIRLNWNPALNANRYEIRIGPTWETGIPILTTAQNAANLSPVALGLIYGTYIFHVKGISPGNKYSVNPASISLDVPVISGPPLIVTGIQNNALLSWSDPPSLWEIAYYIIYKNGIESGYIDGNFMISSELIGGTYTYEVQAVDIVGNVGQKSAAVSIILEDPIDLIFVASVNAQYNGEYINTFKALIDDATGVAGAYPVLETYQQHFINNAFTSPQAQVNAGYERWLSPTGDLGSYREVFDFGTILNNSTIYAYYTKINLFGATDVTTQIRYSEDLITWSTPVIAQAVLGIKFRYVEVTWLFDNTDDESLAFITALRVAVSTQLILDSGNFIANKDHIGGTLVTLNKTYKQINSITLTSDSLNPITLIYDAAGTNTFLVFAYGNAGNRVTTPFSWKVRGIV